MNGRALLTVSGRIDPSTREAIDNGQRPRADYFELANAMAADIIDHSEARRTSGRMARRWLSDDLLLALACFRRRRQYGTVFTDSERVGYPFAALCRLARKRTRHVMIAHRLSASKKMRLHGLLGLRRRIDHVVVYATSQQQIATDQLGYRAEQTTLTPFMVDTDFWRSDTVPRRRGARRMICAVGQELRDYPTLAEAVRDLDVDVVIAAASPWSRRADSSAGLDVPANVEVGGYNLFDLRQLYADAEFVVVPLEETDFQAGITTILEAMSMGLAVVCTRTPGQTDTIVDGVNGLYVPPGDAVALRTAIARLLDDPDLAARSCCRRG